MFLTNFSGHYGAIHFECFQPASARFYSRHCYFRRDASESQMTRLSRSLKLLISAICMQYTHRIDFPIGRNQSIIYKSFILYPFPNRTVYKEVNMFHTLHCIGGRLGGKGPLCVPVSSLLHLLIIIFLVLPDAFR